METSFLRKYHDVYSCLKLLSNVFKLYDSHAVFNMGFNLTMLKMISESCSWHYMESVATQTDHVIGNQIFYHIISQRNNIIPL